MVARPTATAVALWWSEGGDVRCAEHAPQPEGRTYVEGNWGRIPPENARELRCDECGSGDLSPTVSDNLPDSVSNAARQVAKSLIFWGLSYGTRLAIIKGMETKEPREVRRIREALRKKDEQIGRAMTERVDLEERLAAALWNAEAAKGR